MKLAFDPETDSLYIHLNDKPGVEPDEIADGVVLDFDADSALVGIDVQHARTRADLSRLLVTKLQLMELSAA